MRQNLGNEKVLAIQALSASYGKLPNALVRARNEKVACSSQVTSSIKTAAFMRKRRFSCVKSYAALSAIDFIPSFFRQ
jgi:hypothetical protein